MVVPVLVRRYDHAHHRRRAKARREVVRATGTSPPADMSLVATASVGLIPAPGPATSSGTAFLACAADEPPDLARRGGKKKM